MYRRKGYKFYRWPQSRIFISRSICFHSTVTHKIQNFQLPYSRNVIYAFGRENIGGWTIYTEGNQGKTNKLVNNIFIDTDHQQSSTPKFVIYTVLILDAT